MSGMMNLPPLWSMRPAQRADRLAAVEALRRGHLNANWDPTRAWFHQRIGKKPPLEQPPKAWARTHGWPTPIFGFTKAFLQKMLESDANFDLALTSSGVELYLPVDEHRISEETLGAWDDLYAESGQSWDALVASLQEVCRAIDMGVVVSVEEKPFRDVGAFYRWAHSRYHALEEGSDRWMLDGL